MIAEADTLVLHDFGDSQAELIPAIEDDPTTGAVYLEQWTSSNAIADRVDVVGDPDSSTTAFNERTAGGVRNRGRPPDLRRYRWSR